MKAISWATPLLKIIRQILRASFPRSLSPIRLPHPSQSIITLMDQAEQPTRPGSTTPVEAHNRVDFTLVLKNPRKQEAQLLQVPEANSLESQEELRFRKQSFQITISSSIEFKTQPTAPACLLIW